ncbi:MAG: SapC family protein, partial [Caulobacteraceae bacterium]
METTTRPERGPDRLGAVLPQAGTAHPAKPTARWGSAGRPIRSSSPPGAMWRRSPSRNSAPASLCYPIIFSGEQRQPIVVMGLNEGQNMFVSQEGVFEPDAYIPMYIPPLSVRPAPAARPTTA